MCEESGVQNIMSYFDMAPQDRHKPLGSKNKMFYIHNTKVSRFSPGPRVSKLASDVFARLLNGDEHQERIGIHVDILFWQLYLFISLHRYKNPLLCLTKWFWYLQM